LKALVKQKAGREGLSVIEVEEPVIGADDVLVEIKSAAICGTDLHIMDDTYPVDMPVTIGHEFSGSIARLGANVRNWSIGDRVIAAGNVENCGTCFLCAGGNANLCRDNKYLGIRADGVFARYARIPAKLLHRIPDSISFDEAALAEPAAVAIDAMLVKNSVQVGDFVVILGCGPIGLLAGQIAKAVGAGGVMITGRQSAVKSRFSVAEELGSFDYIVNVEKDDPVAIVMEATHGKGADIIIDTTGNSAALTQAFDMVRRAGVIEIIGIGDQVVEVPWSKMFKEAVKIHFCRGTTNKSFDMFCDLAASGKLNLKPMVTNTFPLADWKKGFDSAEHRDSVKTLLIP
jgi:L-iditol 2-dehydrogenase